MLCVLYETHDGPHVLLTRRSPTMRHHAHEISFPGGRRDDTDPDLWSTALREAEEEVARPIVGGAGRWTRPLHHCRIPHPDPPIAVSESPPKVHVASPGEVEAIVHVSLAELLSDVVWREEIWTWQGATQRP